MMTKRLFLSLQTAISILCLFLIVGCEDPTHGDGQIAPPNPEVKAETEVETPVVGPEQEKSEETTKVEGPEGEKAKANEPGYPYFHVYRDGEKLIVDGVLKSKGQVDQITSELEAYFTKLEVESGLRKDHLRHGVGWGNRVSDAVLFDYFTMVTNPDLEYKEGIITLKGTVENSRQHREITERVIGGFSDVWTNDIVNEIEVRN